MTGKQSKGSKVETGFHFWQKTLETSLYNLEWRIQHRILKYGNSMKFIGLLDIESIVEELNMSNLIKNYDATDLQ